MNKEIENRVKGFKLGENADKYTWLVLNDEDMIALSDKNYFNKLTKSIQIFNCKLGNEHIEIIDNSKNILLIQVLYTPINFGERIYKLKEYIYMDKVLYMPNKDIKRIPNEIKYAIEDYYNQKK